MESVGKVVYIKDRAKVTKATLVKKEVTCSARLVEEDPIPNLPRNEDGSPDFLRWIIENLED